MKVLRKPKNGQVDWMRLAFLACLALLSLLIVRQFSEEKSAAQQQLQNGWSTIQVFHGDDNLLQQAPPGGWAAQSNQDEIVAALTKNKKGGFFLDLAANEAVRISNTYSLEKKLDWDGLCLEANPIYWRELSFRKCQVVGAVVGKNRMERVQFALRQGFDGGIAGDQFDNSAKQHAEGAVAFYTVPLLEILQQNHAPKLLDYFSLDVEGAEYFIMEDFPFSDYKIRVMTIERPNAKLRQLLENNGYELIKVVSDYGESLWVHSSAKNTLDLDALERFELPDQAVERKRLEDMSYSWLNKGK